MKRTNYLIIVAIIITAGLLSSGCATKKSLVGKNGYDLQYQFQEGTSFAVTSSTDMHTEMDQMGQIIETDIIGKNSTNYTVLSVDKEKGASFEVEFLEIEQDVNSPMGESSTDFSGIIGKKTSFRLTPKGKSEDMKGFDKLTEILTGTGETMNEELYKLGVSGTFFTLPEKPVKMGESWTDETTTDLPYGGGNIKSISTSTYKLVEKTKIDGLDCLKIETTGLQTLTGSFEQNGMALGLKRDTKSNGTLYFATAKGMYVSLVSESVGDGLITVEGQGLELPQTITTKANISVKFK